jgi:predicted nucleic acid-binding protein
MPYAKLDFEAAVDVGIIVIAHFKNPARVYAAQLLLDALAFKRRILIPVSAYLGAYIIMTKYLKLRRERTAKALLKTLTLESLAFYEVIPKNVAKEAIVTASEIDVSSWDTYLIELAKNLGLKKIYTVDKELAEKVKDIQIENPIPEDVMRNYHDYVQKRIK